MFYTVSSSLTHTLPRSKSRAATCFVIFLLFAFLLTTFLTSSAQAAAINADIKDSRLSSQRALVNEGLKSDDALVARELFKAALEDAPDDAELRGYIANAIAVTAFREYEDGRYQGASALFAEALKVKEDVEFYKGRAMCLVKLGDIEGALTILLPYRREPLIGKYLVSLYSALGERYYLEGDLERALHNFILGAEFDYTNKYVMTRLKVLAGEYGAENDFRTKEGSHFIVKYDAAENAVLGNLVSILLEEAYLRIGYDFGHYPKDMIEAVLYTRQQFRDITKSPSWVGAIYDGRIKIPVGGITDRTELLEGVLFHEYSHAVVHRVTKGTAPMWLNEGFAQYVEGKRLSSNQDKYLKELIGERRFSLRDLEGSFMRLSSKEAHNAYLMSLSAIEYIINDFGSFSAISIMERLGEGASIDSAILDTLYLSYDDFIDSWLRSVRR